MQIVTHILTLVSEETQRKVLQSFKRTQIERSEILFDISIIATAVQEAIIRNSLTLEHHIAPEHDNFEEIDVDAVLLWVNPDDPHWNKDMLEAKGDLKIPSRRYSTHGEINLALSGIKKNFPWIKKTYLIVSSNSQIEAAPLELQGLLIEMKVQIVVHLEFIPTRFLPTYNSNTIDSFICNIPSLSKFVLKIDDDVFAMKMMEKSDFLSRTADGKVQTKVYLGAKITRSHGEGLYARSVQHTIGVAKLESKF